MDQEGCRRRLFDLLHPDGLACPRCDSRDGLSIHRRRPDSPVVDHRCKGCRRVFNMYTKHMDQVVLNFSEPSPRGGSRKRAAVRAVCLIRKV